MRAGSTAFGTSVVGVLVLAAVFASAGALVVDAPLSQPIRSELPTAPKQRRETAEKARKLNRKVIIYLLYLVIEGCCDRFEFSR